MWSSNLFLQVGVLFSLEKLISDLEGRYLLFVGYSDKALVSLISYVFGKKDNCSFSELFHAVTPKLEGVLLFGVGSNVDLDSFLDKTR